jgi:hypothetical protein
MFAFIIIVLILLLLAFFVLKVKSAGGNDFPYQKAKALFSPAERSFLGVIDQVVGTEFRVFGKVRIADVATVKTMSNRSAWQKAFNRISAKHFDFIICRSSDLSIVCAVELNDKSHQKNSRKLRDEFVAGVCNSISVPLVEINAQASYSIQELKERFSEILNPPALELKKSA